MSARPRRILAALAACLVASAAFAQEGGDPIGDLLGDTLPAPHQSSVPLAPGDAAPGASDPAPYAGQAIPTLDGGAVTIDEVPDASAEPFLLPPLPPPPQVDPLKQVPSSDTVDYAYGAFQRGLYLTAFAIAIRRAEAGEATAKALIGTLYAHGFGVPQDPEEAAVWYRLAADDGDPAAMVELANLHAIGLGVPKDIPKAKGLLEAALGFGRTDAAYGLGLIELDPSNPKADKARAASLFGTAAENGVVDAQYALAVMTIEGQGVPPDPKEAARLMGLAARGGHIGAQVEYAIMLFNGHGVPKDEKTAAAWFEVAARAGNPVAQNRLARLYATGHGVPLDLKRAARWHLSARAAGISDLMLDGVVETLPPADRAAAARAGETGGN